MIMQHHNTDFYRCASHFCSWWGYILVAHTWEDVLVAAVRYAASCSCSARLGSASASRAAWPSLSLCMPPRSEWAKLKPHTMRLHMYMTCCMVGKASTFLPRPACVCIHNMQEEACSNTCLTTDVSATAESCSDASYAKSVAWKTLTQGGTNVVSMPFRDNLSQIRRGASWGSSLEIRTHCTALPVAISMPNAEEESWMQVFLNNQVRKSI